MRKLNRILGTLALVGLCACGVVRSEQTKPPAKATVPSTSPPPSATPNPAILQDYNARVTTYMELHKQAAQKSPPPKASNDSGKIKAAQEMLAATIQSM